MTQALTVSKILKEDGHTVTGLMVGKVKRRLIPQYFFESADTQVGYYPTPEFHYTSLNKRVSLFKTIIYNLTPSRVGSMLSSIRYIHNVIKEHNPDIIINFYEPLFGVYAMTYKPKVKIVSIAHQFMIFAKGSYYADGVIGKHSLKLLSAICRSRSSVTIALSVYPWISKKSSFKVIPPLLREDLFKLKPYDGGYLLCYILNIEYAKDLREWHNNNKDVVIHVFWDNFGAPEGLVYNENLHFHHIDDKKFLKYLEGCSGLITTSGFEAICEAAFLGKPVLMTPAHLEQRINAYEFAKLKFGIVSKELNPTLLVEYIKKKKGDIPGDLGYRNRILSAERILLDTLGASY